VVINDINKDGFTLDEHTHCACPLGLPIEALEKGMQVDDWHIDTIGQSINIGHNNIT
jgi:hypothetical protein